jgi:cytochrome c oxidase subunit 4
VALMVLLLLTFSLAEIDLGRWNFIAATGIAGVKALLIILYFMHVRYSGHLTWIVAAAGFFMLAILLGGSFNDYLSRGWTPFSEQGGG